MRDLYLLFKDFWKSFPSSVKTITLVNFLFIARKTFLNTAREVGDYSATGGGSGLALLCILLACFVLFSKLSIIKRYIGKVSPFTNYYFFALLSFLWVGNFVIIMFKGSEVIASFFLVCTAIYLLPSVKQCLFYIIMLATTATSFDLFDHYITIGFGFWHTNGYTYTSMIALLLMLGALKVGLYSFKTLKWLIFFHAFAFITGTSSASYIAFLIGLIFYFSAGRKKINVGKTFFICVLAYIFYAVAEDTINSYVFYGKNQHQIESGTGRVSIYNACFEAWKASPIFGHGFLVGERSLSQYGLGLQVISAHNTFLSVLVNTGIIGLILYLLFWLRLGVRLIKLMGKTVYVVVLIPAIVAAFVNANAFPAIGSDWNYVAPTIYGLLAMVMFKIGTRAEIEETNTLLRRR